MHRSYGNGTLYTIQVTRNIRHEVSTWRRLWDVKQPWTCRNKCFVSTWPRKKKTRTNNSIPPMSPLHPRKKYGLLKGLLTSHDPSIRPYWTFGKRWYSLWSTKMPGQRPQLPILDCSVKSILEGMVKSAWKLLAASIGCLFMLVNCWPCCIF